MSAQAQSKPRFPLATQVLLGLLLGVTAGLFFGEMVGFLHVVGEAFIKLLQMTVIPYIVVSLIGGLGRLSLAEAKNLALKGGAVLLVLWAIGIVLIFFAALALPNWPSASFFTESLSGEPEPVDFLRLYIPSNPFYALANAIIPAIVLFSIVTGLALIGVRRKESLLQTLSAFADALMRATGLVAKLAPIGVFALTASAAGTMDTEDLGRLQIYLVIYGLLALILSLWVLPALVSVVTPLSYRQMFRDLRAPLITALATGSVLVVLPLLAERCKRVLGRTEEYTGEAGEEAQASVDVLVPTFYNFPTLGFVLALSFVPFAGWYIGSSVSVADYPLMIGAGLASLFGGTVLAIPFVLELVRLPSDLFHLFLTVDVLAVRLAALLGAAHIVAITLISTYALQGKTRVRIVPLLRFGIGSVALVAAVLIGVRAFYSNVVVVPYTKDQALAGLFLLREPHSATVFREPPDTAEYAIGGPRSLTEILDSGVLRVCYLPDSYPLAFFNTEGDLVGFDIEMAHRLARKLNLHIEFLPSEGWRGRAARLNEGYCDIDMSADAIAPERAVKMLLTTRIATFTLSFMVLDHRRDRFVSWDRLQRSRGLRVAVADHELAIKFFAGFLPNVTLIPLKSNADTIELLDADHERFDAIAGPAEEMAAWNILYPRFRVVVPRPTVKWPVGYALPHSSLDLLRVVDAWLLEAEQTGDIDELRAYWVGGKIEQTEPPRWSVIRDVLHWVD